MQNLPPGIAAIWMETQTSGYGQSASSEVLVTLDSGKKLRFFACTPAHILRSMESDLVECFARPGLLVVLRVEEPCLREAFAQLMQRPDFEDLACPTR